MTTRALSSISSFAIPGIEHQTLAGPADGLRQLEVWSQVVAPGGATPVHRHDCEEVIVVLEGRGRYETPTSAEDFVAPAVLTIAAARLPAKRWADNDGLVASAAHRRRTLAQALVVGDRRPILAPRRPLRPPGR